ncbi:hypothetical protein [Haladaptatus halobius]|nr:hypothetical protein [Haladaptatus halobius]
MNLHVDSAGEGITFYVCLNCDALFGGDERGTTIYGPDPDTYDNGSNEN